MEVTLITGIPEVEEIRFQRNLEDYLSGRGIACSLTQRMGAVWKDDTDLTLADQCDLMSWLNAQAYVSAAVVSELKLVDGIEDVEGTQLRMEVYSVASIAACVLYRLFLIQPEVFAQVLGGFVVPHYAN
jgi:hypothetical protein